MAERGAPIGNTNGAKQKRLLSDCLKRELTQKPQDVLAIALRLIDDAKQGDAQARALLFERVDGKVPQAIVGDDDEPPISIKEIIIRAVDARTPEEGK